MGLKAKNYTDDLNFDENKEEKEEAHTKKILKNWLQSKYLPHCVVKKNSAVKRKKSGYKRLRRHGQ